MKINFKRSFKYAILALAFVIVSVQAVQAFTVPVAQHSASPVALVSEDGVSISSTNPIATTTVSTEITTITDGRKVVTTAGTAVAVGTGAFVTCVIQAEEDNTGDIVIGGSGVIANLSTREGLLLTPSASKSYSLPSDLSIIFIDAEVSGDGVTFSCEA